MNLGRYFGYDFPSQKSLWNEQSAELVFGFFFFFCGYHCNINTFLLQLNFLNWLTQF